MYKLESLLIATRNGGKLREFRSLLDGAGMQIVGLADIELDVECAESGHSFAENARIKALAYSKHTPLPVLADDSGLEVFALGGRPGIYSARYGGPVASDADRNEKLLEEMRMAGGDRRARFVCALALARQGVALLESEGECRGLVAHRPSGSNGFGYDPIFLFPELGRTYAELNEEEKNRYSHRARAVQVLIEVLDAGLASLRLGGSDS
jgi:XTP/dITP diphosphohydrolase